jgi:hypothetical protein
MMDERKQASQDSAQTEAAKESKGSPLAAKAFGRDV